MSKCLFCDNPHPKYREPQDASRVFCGKNCQIDFYDGIDARIFARPGGIQLTRDPLWQMYLHLSLSDLLHLAKTGDENVVAALKDIGFRTEYARYQRNEVEELLRRSVDGDINRSDLMMWTVPYIKAISRLNRKKPDMFLSRLFYTVVQNVVKQDGRFLFEAFLEEESFRIHPDFLKGLIIEPHRGSSIDRKETMMILLQHPKFHDALKGLKGAGDPLLTFDNIRMLRSDDPLFFPAFKAYVDNVDPAVRTVIPFYWTDIDHIFESTEEYSPEVRKMYQAWREKGEKN